MLSATALVFAVNTVTSILKNYVIPKVGKTGTQFILFVSTPIVTGKPKLLLITCFYLVKPSLNNIAIHL